MVDWQDTKYTEAEWAQINDHVNYSGTVDEGGIYDLRSKAREDAWNHIQDEIIWALDRTINEDWEEKYFTKVPVREGDTLAGQLDMGYSLDFDRDGYYAEQARISKGLLYFGKYFQALWD
jgi:hypothetical protein